MRVETALNRHVVEMVKPDKCIRHHHFYNNEARICDDCFLCNGDFCIYETVEVEYASGSYEINYDKLREYCFEQFCCPKCGELIKQESDRSIDWINEDIKCKHCNSEYVCINDDWKNEKLILARNVKKD